MNSPRLVPPSGVPASLLRPAPPLDRPFTGIGLSREMGSPATTSNSGALLVDELATVACRRLCTADIVKLREKLGDHLLRTTEGQHAAHMHAAKASRGYLALLKQGSPVEAPPLCDAVVAWPPAVRQHFVSQVPPSPLPHPHLLLRPLRPPALLGTLPSYFHASLWASVRSEGTMRFVYGAPELVVSSDRA